MYIIGIIILIWFVLYIFRNANINSDAKIKKLNETIENLSDQIESINEKNVNAESEQLEDKKLQYKNKLEKAARPYLKLDEESGLYLDFTDMTLEFGSNFIVLEPEYWTETYSIVGKNNTWYMSLIDCRSGKELKNEDIIYVENSVLNTKTLINKAISAKPPEPENYYIEKYSKKIQETEITDPTIKNFINTKYAAYQSVLNEIKLL